MKKRLFYLFVAIAMTLFLAGCETTNEAAGTVPWGAPASFEGAGVGLPNMNEGQ
jgi:hypothetical protein